MDNDDIRLQIIDIGEQDDYFDNPNDPVYIINIFGVRELENNEYEQIYVKVVDFKPYFYIQIPNIPTNLFVRQIMGLIIDRKGVDSLMDKTDEKVKNISEGLSSHCLVNRKEFFGFNGDQLLKFIKLEFKTLAAFRTWRDVITTYKDQYQTKLYESNISPFLRFIHDRDIEPASWITISEYGELENKITHDDTNIQCCYKKINRLEKYDMAPWKVAAFDIECQGLSNEMPTGIDINEPIIQIGTTFNYLGKPGCYLKYIVSLQQCDPIKGAIVISCKNETELLIKWSSIIKKENPDIITGYNIFGFDYKYIKQRCDTLMKCNKMSPKQYNEFAKLGKWINKPSMYQVKDFSSKAVGENKMYYYEATGRVTIDLMKIIQRDHKLGSYTLDNVSSFFLRGDIMENKITRNNGLLSFNTSNAYGIELNRFIKINYKNGYIEEDVGVKFRVKQIIENSPFQTKSGKTVNSTRIIVQDSEEVTINPAVFQYNWSLVKDDLDHKLIKVYQKKGKEFRAIIAEYCLQDCVLCNQLMEKLFVLVNSSGMANVTYVPLSYIFMRGQGIKAHSLTLKACAKERYIILALKVNQDERDKPDYRPIEGATVLVPEKGLHTNPIGVLDYTSLYPSSMIQNNISHECYVLDPAYDNLPGYTYNTVKYNEGATLLEHRFASKEGELGILPKIVDDLMSKRKAVNLLKETEKDPFKKKVYDGLQNAYKVTANSIYGQTGSPTSSIFFKELAGCTTATGRVMLHTARLFTNYILPKVLSALRKGTFNETVALLYGTDPYKIDKIIGEKMIERLKNIHYKDNEDPDDNSHMFKPTEYEYLETLRYSKTQLSEEKLNAFFTKIRDTLNNEILSLGYKMTPNCVYGDTDSIFVDFGILDENGKELLGEVAIMKTITICKLNGIMINNLLPSPQDLKYEKTFYPWVIISKKRYVGNKYVDDAVYFTQDSMGLVIKRRDNAPIVKLIVGGITNIILSGTNKLKSQVKRELKLFVQNELDKILGGKYEITKFVISKTLKTSYKKPDQQSHVVLARRITKRDPGGAPQTNDRIPYVFIRVKGEVKLQGERVEDPKYVITHSLPLDYIYYVNNQIMKPALQFLSNICKNPYKIFEKKLDFANNCVKGYEMLYLDRISIKGSSVNEFDNVAPIKTIPKRAIKKRARKITKISETPGGLDDKLTTLFLDMF